MGNQTTAKAKKGDLEIDVAHHESDSPILPVSQIERLHAINPERVNWVFEQTQIEAEHRREQSKKRDLLIFTERILGLIFVVGLCSGAIYIAYLLAMSGHDNAAIAIGSTAPVGLFSAFFSKFKK